MDKISLQLLIPQDHACFSGHFPGSPLVPGALLLSWLRLQLEKEISVNVVGIKQIKFLAPVLPGQQLNLDVALKATQIQMVASCNGLEVFKGTLLIATEM